MATLSSHLLNSVDGTHANGVKVIINQINSSGEKIVFFETETDNGGRILKDFDLGGYHFRSNEPVIDVRGSSSRSLHKIEELVQLKENFEYVFLGPVFRSISKKGYGPKISLNQIFSVLKNDALNHLSKKPKVYALGGIRKKKMIRLAEVGFSGVALLGAVWGSSDPLRALKEFLSMGSYFPSS